MRRVTVVLLASLAMTLFAMPVFAQGERRVGFVIAYPSSVGVQWHAADKLAFRVDADYNQFTTEATSEFGFSRLIPPIPGLPPFIPESIEVTTTSRVRNIELGLSVLFDVHRTDQLRLYVAPRIGVNFGQTEMKTEFGGNPATLAALTIPADSDSSSTSPSGGVALGASHDLSDRFRVFGEAGFHYLRDNFSGAISSDLKNSAFGLRAGVGAVILF